MFSHLRRFFHEHPTMLLTSCYFIITAIGVLYSYFFYREFDINILKLADLSDFLLASILEPYTLLAFIFLSATSFLLFLLDTSFRKRFPKYGKFAEKRFFAKYTDPIGFLFIVVVLNYSFIESLAINNSRQIKQDGGDIVLIRLADPGKDSAEKQLSLLGSSSRYAYFFDTNRQTSLIIPVENVSFIRKNLTNTLKKSPKQPKPVKEKDSKQS